MACVRQTVSHHSTLFRVATIASSRIPPVPDLNRLVCSCPASLVLLAADDHQNSRLELLHRTVEIDGLVDIHCDRRLRARAVEDGRAPETVMVPAGLWADRLGEDAHAELGQVGRAWV